MRTSPRPQESAVRRSRMLSAVSLAASGLLLLSVLLPWMSITVIVTLSVDGADTSEGVICLGMAVIGGAAAVAGLVTARPVALLATGVAGAVALLAEIVLAVRPEESFADAVSPEEAREIESLVQQSVSLETGWFLAIIAALVMVSAGAYTASTAGRGGERG